MPRAAPRQLQHRQREIDADRSEAALREKIDRQAGAACDIEMRSVGGRKSRQHFREDAAHRAEEALAERLIVSVREFVVGLAQCAIAWSVFSSRSMVEFSGSSANAC